MKFNVLNDGNPTNRLFATVPKKNFELAIEARNKKYKAQYKEKHFNKFKQPLVYETYEEIS